MNTKELKEKSTGDLLTHLKERREELHKLRFSTAGSGMRNTQAIKNLRHEIAQTLTELSERDKALAKQEA
jgi:ribosomal protein L29